MPIYQPEKCLNAEFEGSCEPLAQIISDDELDYDCCGRLLPEHREGNVKFRHCCAFLDLKRTKVIDCSERGIITTVKILVDALHIIANQRNNTEIKPFQPLKEVPKN